MSPLACDDRSGFLFAHACDRPAAGACSVCGKPICTQHTRMSAQGPTCITCLHQTGVDAGTGEDDPYFDDDPARAAAYYDADDYRAFDPAPDQPSGLETQTGAS